MVSHYYGIVVTYYSCIMYILFRDNPNSIDRKVNSVSNLRTDVLTVIWKSWFSLSLAEVKSDRWPLAWDSEWREGKWGADIGTGVVKCWGRLSWLSVISCEVGVTGSWPPPCWHTHTALQHTPATDLSCTLDSRSNTFIIILMQLSLAHLLLNCIFTFFFLFSTKEFYVAPERLEGSSLCPRVIPRGWMVVFVGDSLIQRPGNGTTSKGCVAYAPPANNTNSAHWGLM